MKAPLPPPPSAATVSTAPDGRRLSPDKARGYVRRLSILAMVLLLVVLLAEVITLSGKAAETSAERDQLLEDIRTAQEEAQVREGELLTQIDNLNMRIDDLNAQISILQQQVRDLGGVPANESGGGGEGSTDPSSSPSGSPSTSSAPSSPPPPPAPPAPAPPPPPAPDPPPAPPPPPEDPGPLEEAGEAICDLVTLLGC